jgi:hypothetical protein
MPVFIFNIGDRTADTISAQIGIHGISPDAALEYLKDRASKEPELAHESTFDGDEPAGADFYSVYLSPTKITVENLVLLRSTPCHRDDCDFCGPSAYAGPSERAEHPIGAHQTNCEHCHGPLGTGTAGELGCVNRRCFYFDPTAQPLSA